MNLAMLIERETGVEPERIMFLRHGVEMVRKVRKHGATIEELSGTQKINERYDFFHPDLACPISVVVVIVDDKVYGVYGVGTGGVAGTISEISTPQYQKVAVKLNESNAKCRRSNLAVLNSACTGLSVHGWKGKERTTVQRYDGGFFNEIEVGPGIAKD